MALKPEYEGSMTPDDLLVALRDMSQDIRNGCDEYTFTETAWRMAELFEVLDEWITGNNTLPSDWQSLSRARLEVVESEVRQKQQSLSDWMDEQKESSASD